MGRWTGIAFQPLEEKAERRTAEALRVRDIGVPGSLFCHRLEKMDLQPLHRGRGGGHLYILIGTTVAPAVGCCLHRHFFLLLEVSCVVEAQAFP